MDSGSSRRFLSGSSSDTTTGDLSDDFDDLEAAQIIFFPPPIMIPLPQSLPPTEMQGVKVGTEVHQYEDA